MTGILPNNGVPPEDTQNGIANPDLAIGCENRYYPPRCSPRVDPFAMNALISEIINALNSVGIAYDCNRLDNLQQAFALFTDDPVVPVQNGVPYALARRLENNGVGGGAIANGVWNTQKINNIESDPGGLINVGIGGTDFSTTVAAYVEFDTTVYRIAGAQARIFNVTDNVEVTLSDCGGTVTGEASNSSYHLSGRFFATAGKRYRLQIFGTGSNGSGFGLGLPAGSGSGEVYALLSFWRVPQ